MSITDRTKEIVESSISARILAILVEHAGAYDDPRGHERTAFFAWFHEGNGAEYRFGGALGFGGKFWREPRWRVTCYPEDETPERLEIIARTNKALAKLDRELGEGKP